MTLRNVLYKWEDTDALVCEFRDIFETQDIEHVLLDDERHLLDIALRELRQTERGLRGTTVKLRLLLTDGRRREICTPLHLEVELTVE